MTRVPYGKIFDGERELAPDDADENWYGRELERHARRANAALDERDRFGRIFVELAHVAKLLELLELLREPFNPRAFWEAMGQEARAVVGDAGGQSPVDAARILGTHAHHPAFAGRCSHSSPMCTCVDHDRSHREGAPGEAPPVSGCPVHSTSGALAEVLELSRRRR